MTAHIRPALLGATLATAAALAAPNGRLAAQQGVVGVAAAGAPTPIAPAAASEQRLPLGLTVGTSGSSRDTLGLLIVAVVPQSPAD
ncbi:MAG TPA: hypothetical protein VGD56_05270, partial [Gemmatirosa sp.]